MGNSSSSSKKGKDESKDVHRLDEGRQADAPTPALDDLTITRRSVREYLYKMSLSAKYAVKIEDVFAKFDDVVLMPRDGNCYYLGYFFSLLVWLSQRASEGERRATRAALAGAEAAAAKHHTGDPATIAETWALALGELDWALAATRSGLDLARRFARSDPAGHSRWHACVRAMRLTAAAHVRDNGELLQYYLPEAFANRGDCGVSEFCAAEVEPLGRDADHVACNALATVLGAAVEVVYLTPGGPNDALRTVILPEGADSPVLTLLYTRPGHYDVVYEKGRGAWGEAEA